MPVTDVPLTQTHFLKESLKSVSLFACSSVTIQHDFYLQKAPAFCKQHTKGLFPDNNI